MARSADAKFVNGFQIYGKWLPPHVLDVGFIAEKWPTMQGARFSILDAAQ